MSTLAVNTITNAAGGNTATINGMTPTADSLQGFRNRIFNGGMVIDQRNAGAALTINDSTLKFPVDRFIASGTASAGVFTAQRSTVAPTGFNNSVVATVTTASTPSATQGYAILQHIEGFSVADLGFGTANAQTVTLSFWVRSSLTGTFGGSLRNGLADRSFPFSYTISAANTWEQKSITIAGDTSGTWDTTNGLGMRLVFSLGRGSDGLGTAGAWVAANYSGVIGQTNLIATSGATFYITGVQLEAGSVATPFERRPYGTELALCQRYYYRTTAPTSNSIFGPAFAQNATDGRISGFFPVTMRTRPTALEQSGTAANYNISSGGVDRVGTAVPAYNTLTNEYAWFVNTTVSGGQTAGLAGVGYASTAGAFLAWSAEL